MTLLIDIGNTRVKLAVLRDGAVAFLQAIDTGNAQVLKDKLSQVIQTQNTPIHACIAVSVGHPEINQTVERVLAPIRIQWVRPSAAAAGVANGYPDPSQLGADRWVSMIGLTRHYSLPHRPIVLASFGTATTVDTLSPDNQFKGGLILPGVSMMHASLAHGTANLPNAVGALTPFPTDTVSAITSGIVAAQIGAVLRQVQLAHETYNQLPEVCVTGGAWLTVADELRRAHQTQSVKELPHVVLDGLGILASQAKG